ncbi:hypothetical protein [Treponema sp. R80B11-R83G3]
MTINEICKEYNLDKTEQAKIKFAEQRLKARDFSSDFARPDEHLKYLVEQIYQTIHEWDNNINWKLIVLTMPMYKFNAGAFSLTEKCKLIISDNNILAISNTLAQLMGKLIPKCKYGIVPSIDDDLNDIRDKINHIQLLDVNDYNEFKKAVLYSNDGLRDIHFNISNMDKISEQLRDAILIFILAHEFAHVLLGHQKYENENNISGVAKNWIEIETEADILGYELMKNTMARIYKDVIRKAEFNLGFEVYLKYLAIDELLSIIFKESDFSGTHPDAGGSRIDSLRKEVEKTIPWKINEETEDTKNESQMEIVSFHYIIDIINNVFDSYEKKLFQEIIGLAAAIDKQSSNEKDFLVKLWDKINESSVNEKLDFSENDIPCLKTWNSGYLTKAVCEFADGGYENKFYRILAMLHCYEYEKYYFRMFSCIGPGEGFAQGVNYLNIERFDLAEKCFKKVIENKPNEFIVAFALGYTYTKWGEKCYYKGDFKEAIDFFNLSLNSPVVCRETFKYRSDSYKKLRNSQAEAKDKEITNILYLVPNTDERGIKFTKDRQVL